MTTISKIKYFRACFEADNRSQQLYAFFGRKVAQAKIVEDSDVLTGKLPYLPVADDWGAKSLQTLTMYAKEKRLFYCAFFVFGSTRILNKRQKMTAPLLLYPAELQLVKEVYRVELTSMTPILNTTAILPLALRNPEQNAIEELTKQLGGGYIGFKEGVYLKEMLDGLFLNLRTDALSEYPEVLQPSDVEKLRKGTALFKEENQFHLVSAMGVGILNRSRSGRGILNELGELSSPNRALSKPLKALLTGVIPKGTSKDARNVYVPAVLNKAQENLIRESHRSNLNIAVGPPGTGKSFTIAALTIDAICRGESVLIASNTKQSVEVIAKKLEEDFALQQPPIKTTDKKWKAQVKKYLENVLSGMGVEDTSVWEMRAFRSRMKKSMQKTRVLEDMIHARIEHEKEWGEYQKRVPASWWTRFRLRQFERRILSVAPLWQLYEDLMNGLEGRNQLLKEHLSVSRQFSLGTVLNRRRRELQFFLKAMRARTGNLKEERFQKVNFDTLFRALPVWLVTLEEVNQVLPLRKEMFDLVIFDEASQCNIASALPVIQRGKKTVIVGDSKQLRHISFLSNHRQEQLLQQCGLPLEELEDLDYRRKSLLDFALDQVEEQRYVHFLNEHYRSLPDLIAFSNQQFYNRSLNLMTDIPTAKTSGNVFVREVGGKRLKRGYNRMEAEAVLKTIEQIIAEEAQLPDDRCHSIGVLSPFREQSEFLIELIGAKVALAKLRRHQVLIGTPHYFQGEERDYMLLSFSLDDNSHPSAYRYLEKADVFNVSITRARLQQHLFISFDPNALRLDGLLRDYFAFLTNFRRTIGRSEPVVRDEFMEEVVANLKGWPLDEVKMHYPISGLDVDLVIVRDGKTYCLDLVGHPGSMEEAFPLERIKMLNRMGIKVFSMSYFYWQIDQEHCLQALKRFLNVD